MNLLRIISLSSRLSSLTRFSMERLSCPESVLEHTGFVSLFSLVLAVEVNAIEPGRLDVATVCSKALLHDIDELVTGDIPRPTKYSSARSKELFEEIKITSADKISGMLVSCFAFSIHMRNHHALSKEGPEGLIIAMADAVAVVYKVWQEVIVRGNLSMTRQAFTVRDQLIALDARVTKETQPGLVRSFLLSVLAQGAAIAHEAASMDRESLATMRED